MMSDLPLLLATTAYSALVENIKKHLEPDFIWLEVAGGTALCLLFPFIARRRGEIATARCYERAVWRAFLIGSLPVIVWQVCLMIRRRLVQPLV